MPRPTRSRAPTAAPTRAVRRLPLASLRVFVAAGEHGSFSRAADALGVTVAAVSLQIRTLEQYLRVPLFVRRGQRVNLTDAGERLLPQLRRSLLEIELALQQARRERATGQVTISVLASFLQQWLLPRIPEFHRQQPQIDLRLHTSPEPVDFLVTDVQAAVRFGEGGWPHVHAARLLDDWLVPIGAPALLEKHGYLRSERDLERFTLLHSDFEPWSDWLTGRVGKVDWSARGAHFDDSAAVVRAAIAGHGLALTRWSLAAADVASGQLALASPRVVPLRAGYWFVCPESYLGIDKVARVREWLFAQAAAHPPPPVIPRA